MPRYTIRVYGLWINSRNEILISDERIGEQEFTKFPGGGMEQGEGPIDCLKREWIEELNAEIEILDHFYTTDFYQKSSFHKDTQVMSLYYLVRPLEDIENNFSELVETFDYTKEREEVFRWVPLGEFTPDYMTFPIDKKVVQLIQKRNAR